MTVTVAATHTIGVEPVTAAIRDWVRGSANRGKPLGEQVIVRRREGRITQVFPGCGTNLDDQAETMSRIWLAEHVPPVTS